MKLSNILAANGVFSAGAGSIMLLMNKELAAHIPLPESAWLVIAVGLMGFAAQLWLMGLSPRLLLKLTPIVIIGDLAWVVMTSVSMLMYWNHLSDIGVLGVVLVNCVVGAFAYFQLMAYRAEREQLNQVHTSFERQIVISSPMEMVWSVLLDYGNIDKWNPGVEQSSMLTEGGVKVGALRRCDIGQNYLKEKIVDMKDQQKLSIEVTETDLPFQKAIIHFELNAPDGQTTEVTVRPEYSLKYGWLGEIFDALFVNKQYNKGMRRLLEGLKQYAENPSM